MGDQRVGKGFRGVLAGVLGGGARLGLLALGLAVLDAGMGGRSRLFEVLSGGVRSLKGYLM